MPVIASLEAVEKSFGDVKALDGIDLTVAEGEIVALLGPNGAGKTTAISILLGLRPPDGGRASLFGGDPRKPQNRSRIGVTPQDTAFPDNLKVSEVLELVAAHYPAPLDAGALLARLGLDDIGDKLANQLSGGQRRLLAVALAFIGGGRALFLDEPTTGLDAVARRVLWDRVRTVPKDGGSVLLTTHYLEEAEALADRVVLIDHGRIVLAGTVDEIRRKVDVRLISFEGETCPALPDVVRVESEDRRHRVYCRDTDAAVRALVASGAAFSDLVIRPVSLEEAVLTTLGKRS